MQNKEAYARNVQRCKENDILIPTFDQLMHPETIPQSIKDELKEIGLWDVNPRNLFRVTWKNEQKEKGGLFDKVNYIEVPKELTGLKNRIFMLVGRFFPTGAHKVGATFGPLVRGLVTGELDAINQKALWPSTGNYCRGGAFNSALLKCNCIAVLPEEMSKERFEWLKEIGAEVVATPGCESNVKEVFDKTTELSKDPNVTPFNQFEIFENPLWHYHCTGGAFEEIWNEHKTDKSRLHSIFLTQGSAGTLGGANYLKDKVNPCLKIGAGEALQCPTMMYNGFGGHRIEGIGDKHVPWVMDVRKLDMVAAIDDEVCMRLLRLFNEPKGRECLIEKGVPKDFVDRLDLLGISGVANLLGLIKMCKYYELDEDDICFTLGTDSMQLYGSRLQELKEERGDYNPYQAHSDWECLQSLTVDHMLEMNYWDKKRMHNLKYFTWVEQQGKETEELNTQWSDFEYWNKKWAMKDELNEAILKFNKDTGLERFK